MADDAGGGGAGGEGETQAAVGAPAGGEESDLGFYNRKLHNFPLIKVRECH